MLRLPRTLAAAVITVSAASLLGACGSDEPSAEQVIEDKIGEVEVGQKVPDGFPEDDVPLAEGKVLQGAESPQGFLVTLDYDGTTEEARAEADKKLAGAGFEKQGDSPVGDVYRTQHWQVLVLSQQAAGRTMLSYTVSALQ